MVRTRHELLLCCMALAFAGSARAEEPAPEERVPEERAPDPAAEPRAAVIIAEAHATDDAESLDGPGVLRISAGRVSASGAGAAEGIVIALSWENWSADQTHALRWTAEGGAHGGAASLGVVFAAAAVPLRPHFLAELGLGVGPGTDLREHAGLGVGIEQIMGRARISLEGTARYAMATDEETGDTYDEGWQLLATLGVGFEF